MSARGKARKRALDLLYAADLRGVAATDVLADHRAENPVNEYTQVLIEGVSGKLEALDEVLEGYVRGWTVARMPAVDRNLLRVAAWEILYSDLPSAVAITEAVRLAGELSTDESPAYVNGVLGNIARDRETLVG